MTFNFLFNWQASRSLVRHWTAKRARGSTTYECLNYPYS